MKRSFKLAASLVGLLPLAVACGGSGPPPTMQGRAGLLSQTAIAQKCEAAAKGHDRPFVVEWDATDLASFEALAHRDTVVVKYEGCDIQVLDQCTDPNIPGKLGAYGLPQFTSGTVQGFDIANQGELYAKLPLGAASLSGKVEAGEALHLKYFVSGVATDSRATLYSSDIASMAGCAGATHFVWGYNLGAFELGSSEQNAEEGHASFGNAGGGGSHGHQQSNVANGGSLASCETNDQRACRVPIRLVLRPIVQGDNPGMGGAVAAGGAPGGPPPVPAAAPALPNWNDTPSGKAAALQQEAMKRKNQGDAQACIDYLDKARNLDPKVTTNSGFIHAQCLMMVGKCDDGKKEMRSEEIKRDPDRRKTDEEIDKSVDQQANNNCTSSSATTPSEFVVRASRELYDAVKANDVKRAKTLATAIDGKMPSIDKKSRVDVDQRARRSGPEAMQKAGEIIATSEGCAAGKPLWVKGYTMQLGGDTPSNNKIVEQIWTERLQHGQIVCH